MIATSYTPSSLSNDRGLAPDRIAFSRPTPIKSGPVLLAIDGAEASDAPLAAARWLAEHLGVSLEVVTVLDRLPVYPSIDPSFPLLVESAHREAREAIVRRRVSDVLGESTRWRLTVRYGSIAREIADVARATSAQLIVVGSGQHRHFWRTIAGRRAIQVLQRAACPVLSVNNDWRGSFACAVVAVDFSPASVRAATAALLALGDNARLHLVHVHVPLDPDVPATDSSLEAGLATMFGRLREELRPVTPPGTVVETHCLSGQIVPVLLRFAESKGADVIAVGTDGVGVRERLFLGSVAIGVIQSAGCAVLASPKPSGAEAVRLALRMAGTVASVADDDWAVMLDAFTRRNAERAVTIEVDDPQSGAQLEVHDYRLTGATYDRHNQRVMLMVRDPGGGSGHLTRTVARPESVALYAGREGRDVALEIKHGTGHTLLLFGDK